MFVKQGEIKIMDNKKALIAMSGGVDSSVAAYLIQKSGYDTIGATMKLFDNGDIDKKDKTCCSLDDVSDARSVAARMGIPFYVFNFKEDFREKVIGKFVDTYKNGGTPNPCIDCNRFLKFDRFLRRADEIGADYIVTGHYARIEFDEKSGRYLLKKAVDLNKDQSYVLYGMTQHELSKTLFPLGGLSKPEVREIAEANGFVNAHKKESQDICFVPDGNYAGFIEGYANLKFPEGDFLDTKGNVIGKHKGIINYTIGQRKGLGSFLKPMFVCHKDAVNNTVTLCEGDELFTKELFAEDINLITVGRLDSPIRVKAKVRYRQAEQLATVEQVGEDRLHIVFDEPQRAISKGQAVVLYDGDTVVGGGTIV